MALQFNPPEWLIQEYMKRKSPIDQTAEGLQKTLAAYAQLEQQQQANSLKGAENTRQEKELAMKGREQFYNTGDVQSLPQEIQSQIGQPAQGPPTEQGAYPQPPPLVARFNNFLAKNPHGLKGSERAKNQELQQSEIDKNIAQTELYGRSRGTGAAPAARPQLRMNQFTGEQEWYTPPASAAPGSVMPGVPSGPAPASHGPGTFRDVSKAAGTFSEDQNIANTVIPEIQRVQGLNKNSRGGLLGAGLQRGQSALNMGTDSPEFKNTADVVNTLKGQVSRVLKSTFGGQLSDSERAYLNEVYGAAERMSPSERDIAMTNVITMLTNKAKSSGAKYGALSGNAPLQGGSSTSQQPPAAGYRVPPGTSGGNTGGVSTGMENLSDEELQQIANGG